MSEPMREWAVLHGDEHPYWIDLLDRLGVPRRRLEQAAPGDGVMFVVAPQVAASAVARRMHAAGVPTIASALAARELSGLRVRKQAAVGVTGGGELFRDCAQILLRSDVVVAESATHGRLFPSGRPAVWVGRSHGTPTVVLPLPDPEALLTGRAELTVFAEHDGVAGELVGRCAHGALRRLVRNALRVGCDAVGMPFVHKAPAPNGAGGSFAVRVDADSFDPDATAAVETAMRRVALRATWFIDVERHQRNGGEPWVRRLQQLGHDVQSHAYHHYTYSDERRNRINLERARQVLKEWGVDSAAAAAPFGSWNDGWRRALLAMGVGYSSEFALAWDDVPGRYPRLGVDAPWQVPVHPVCPVLLSRAGMSADQVYRYFCAYAERTLTAGDPVVIYGHPIGDLQACPDLFVQLAQTIDRWSAQAGGDPVSRLTLGELFAFWRRRADQPIAVRWHNATVDVDCAVGAWVQHPRGEVIRLPASGSADMARSGEWPPADFACSPPSCWSALHRRALRRQQRRLVFARYGHELKQSLLAAISKPGGRV